MARARSPRLLMIGYVWPETNASAAGLRSWALMEQLRAAGYEIHYASPAKPGPFSEKLEALGVPTFSCPANDPRFDDYLREVAPQTVLFERFLIEEQFGWRVEEICPDAARVIDTIDLHCLRRARERAVESEPKCESPDPGGKLSAMRALIEKHAQEDLLRELSAIHRSDLSLIISGFEEELLTRSLGMPQEKLLLQRLSYASHNPASPPLSERRHFVSIGNFRHPPNADAVRWLSREIWPRIRHALPEAELHVYGAYPSREMTELSSPSTGFLVKGWADHAIETLARYRVLLAPLRFGAGIKGKIADAWCSGIPVITTPIGAEGMVPENEMENWPGTVVAASDSSADATDDVAERFAQAAVLLYQDTALASSHQQAGFTALSRHYNPSRNASELVQALERLHEELPERRRRNLVGSMLRLNLHRSTKYLSKWIELKNTRSTVQTLDS